jgi:hypothetical protein
MDTVAINRTQRYSLLADGSVVPWARLLDGLGDPVDTLGEASYALQQLPSGEWETLVLADWETVTIH